jgi:hypothetical protein
MPFQSSVIRINLIHKTERIDASHTLGLRLRSDLTAIAQRDGVKLKIVELPAAPRHLCGTRDFAGPSPRDSAMRRSSFFH